MRIYLGGIYMRLEQYDTSMLFSSINLPDVFFTEYLSQSSFVGLMFPNVDKTILYQKSSGDLK